ncbi:MAG: hypothetical protein J7J92_02845 [Candidatus Aenigmarchaeota archaeon]|nr:hypothetical protein [Candidatus Aenigmarchaeota archaeon]
MGEDFEIVPLNPIRRLEKRLEKLENSKDKDIFSDLLQMIKINQETMDQLTKLNTDLIKEMSNLSLKVNDLTEKLEDFVERIEVESVSDTDQKLVEENKQLREKSEELSEKIEKLEKKINSVLLNTLIKKRAVLRPPKRPVTPRNLTSQSV